MEQLIYLFMITRNWNQCRECKNLCDKFKKENGETFCDYSIKALSERLEEVFLKEGEDKDE